MTRTVLVGSTGFVGGNLLASHTFDAAYHSTDVEKGFGQPNGLVVYAGVPAAMFLANQDPDADLAVMERARWNLQRLAPEKVVLVSSICVYADSRGKTEADEPVMEGLAPYGANRLQLERWVRATQLGLKACEVPVERAYPKAEPTPTKIKGFRGNSNLLKILFAALAGRYAPKQ